MSLVALPGKLFISYSHVDYAAADEVDNLLRALGILAIRDIRDLALKDRIRKFMQVATSADRVIMLLSPSFLKSPACMYEVLHVLAGKSWQDRIIPIIVGPIDVFSADGRRGIVEYWRQQRDDDVRESLPLLNEPYLNAPSIRNDVRHSRAVFERIDEFLSEISDMMLRTLEDLRSNDFAELLRALGLDAATEKLLTRIAAVHGIADPQVRDFRLEQLLREYPQSTDVVFAAGLNAINARSWTKAKYYFREYLDKHPRAWTAYYNLALAEKELNNTSLANSNLKQAQLYIGETEWYGIPFLRAELLAGSPRNLAEACEQLERVILLNPTYQPAYRRLAEHLITRGDVPGAMAQLQRGLAVLDRDAELSMLLEQCRRHAPAPRPGDKAGAGRHRDLTGIAATIVSPLEGLFTTRLKAGREIRAGSEIGALKIDERQHRMWAPIGGTVSHVHTTNGAVSRSSPLLSLNSIRIAAPVAGKVISLAGPLLSSDKRVEHDTVLCKIAMDGGEVEVRTPCAGNIVDPLPNDGAAVRRGANLFHLVTTSTVLATAKTDATDVVIVSSPMVGTVYLSPEPYSKPYVSLGDEVARGKVLFVIEAMKMMNQIESEFDGTVIGIFVENGDPVEFGQPLMLIRL